MTCKTLELLISDVPPYDEADTWFETFVGHHVVPLVPHLNRFWFTRYGGIGSQKWIKFRFECDDIAAFQPHVDALIQKYTLFDQKYQDWDVRDIGEGEKSRFLGDNGKHHDAVKRGELAFNFVHSAALLFIDGLRGPDEHKRFQREPETTSGFNKETSLEQYFHLFSNMTGVPAFVVDAEHPDFGRQILTLAVFAMAKGKEEQEKKEMLAKGEISDESQFTKTWKVHNAARLNF